MAIPAQGAAACLRGRLPTRAFKVFCNRITTRPYVGRLQTVQRRASTVAVGMSGGVDSSVTALLLKRAGYNVIGVHMRNWDTADEIGEAACPDSDDLRYAQQVCTELDIPLQQVDLVEAYWNNVFEPFLDAYSEGATPNPDVWCNREIKFGRFHQYCTESLGVDFVATGHYCQTVRRPEENAPAQLARGFDPIKDQSYFLCLVPPSSLEKALFPLGRLHKSQVRAIAQEAGLATAKRGDSYGICFIGKRKLDGFLPNYIDVTAGEFRDVDTGNIMGHHHGAEFFTVGQNARLSGMDRRWFVVKTDVASGIVTVANSSNHPALYTDCIFTSAEAFNWLDAGAQTLIESKSGLECKYRIRYRQDEMGRCTVTQEDNGQLRVQFQLSQRAATIGQAVALYSCESGDALQVTPVLSSASMRVPHRLDGSTGAEVCLGGGIIDSLGPSYAELGKPSPPLDARMN